MKKNSATVRADDTLDIFDWSNVNISALSKLKEGLKKEAKEKTYINDYDITDSNIDDFLNIVKSKRYTVTRLQRILLYALLNISKKDIELSKKIEKPYVRILGFNENGKRLVSQIALNHPEITLITSVKKFIDSNSNKDLQIMFDKDIFATDVYSLGFENNSFGNLDFKNGIIKRKK